MFLRQKQDKTRQDRDRITPFGGLWLWIMRHWDGHGKGRKTDTILVPSVIYPRRRGPPLECDGLPSLSATGGVVRFGSQGVLKSEGKPSHSKVRVFVLAWVLHRSAVLHRLVQMAVCCRKWLSDNILRSAGWWCKSC